MFGWAKKNWLEVGKEESDTAVVGFEGVEDFFFEGGGVEEASTLVAALLWKLPHSLRGGKNCLPRIRRAIAGWKKISPPRSRRPLPRLAVALLVDQLIQNGQSRLSLVIWMALEFYLRPGEALDVTLDDIVRPPGGNSPWSVLSHPLDRGRSGKTGEFDTSTHLDLMRHEHLRRTWKL